MKIYSTPEDLFKDLDTLPQTIPFYIDSSLGKNSDGLEIKGEEILEILCRLGFTELYLCTGYEAENFAHLKIIKCPIFNNYRLMLNERKKK